MPEYFDYLKVAADAGLSAEQLARLSEGIALEFPRDQMLFELHMLRACRVIRDGIARFEDVERTLPPRKSAA